MEAVARSAAMSANVGDESIATLKQVMAKQLRAYLPVVMSGVLFKRKR